MMEVERHNRHARIAKAAVKSSQAKGNLVLTVVNSRMTIRSVKKQQKHQLNMHHAQYEDAMCPADATRLKQTQARTVVIIRTIPTGWVTDFKSTEAMAEEQSL